MEPKCRVCGGQQTLLGRLGSSLNGYIYFRCQDCGSEYGYTQDELDAQWDGEEEEV